MKIRLEGTKEEIQWAVDSLKKLYSITETSKLYANRDGKSYRCYVELVAFFVRSGSALDSKNEVPISEPQPKSWDAVLGGKKDE